MKTKLILPLALVLQVISIVLLLCGVPATAASAPFTLDEAKAVFAACYAPEMTYTEESRVTRNSQYPGRIVPLWEEASCEISKKGKVTTYHIPFVGERLVFSYYFEPTNKKYHNDETLARRDSQPVRQELIIEKNAKKEVKLYIRSIAASGEGKDPEKFWGMVTYLSLNVPRPFAWESWERGKCIDMIDNSVNSDKHANLIVLPGQENDVAQHHTSAYDDEAAARFDYYPGNYRTYTTTGVDGQKRRTVIMKSHHVQVNRNMRFFRFFGQRNPEFH